MKHLEDYISEQLLKHLYIDYSVLENAGLYDGIESLCLFLTNKIKSYQDKRFIISYKDTDVELSKMNNVFFKNIILDCERSNKNRNEGEYCSCEEIDFDKNCEKFNYVKINMKLSQTHNHKEVYFILLHEITHAWDDFNSYKKSSKNIKTAAKETNYLGTLKLLDENSASKKLLGQLLYFMDEVELNAWVSSFAGYLYDCVNNQFISDPKTALKIIKNSELYNNYVNIGAYIKAIYNDDKRLSKEFIRSICNEYNKIKGTDYTEYKVKKLLYNRYLKTMRKIESSIGKLCVRYVKDLTIK